MASSNESIFSIVKLNNTNHQLWKFKLEMLLSKDYSWDIVNQDKPEEPPNSWEKRVRQAKATISLMVEDDQLIHIRKEDSARGMWLALQKLHERSNLTSKLYLLQKLYKMRLTKGADMRSYINQMLEIVEQLWGLGEELKDDHIAALLPCGIPESYGTLVTALEARPAEELTLELVKGKLINEFNRRQENSEGCETFEAALKIKDAGYKGKKETRKCFFGNKPGHLKKDCHFWKAKVEK